MTTQKSEQQESVGATNTVRLVGRISQPAQKRILPSGDAVTSFRVVVPRAARASRPGSDSLACSAWTARARRTAERWSQGDWVELEGAIRSRFYRGASGPASIVEIEVSRGRLIRRAESA
jgi:single-strand DNA-binding protein